MKKISSIIAFIIFIFIVFLIALPKLESQLCEPSFLTEIKQYFSSNSNKDYFEVMLSVITVLITFLVFYWQNQIEINNKNKEIKQEKEKQEQLYLEQREREHAVVRPLFLVELQGKNSVVRLFFRESAPLTNITVYYQYIENENFQEKFVGNAVSGDCIFRFDANKLESAIIECRTYLYETIYFQYHVGDNLIHYRVVDGEDLNYIRGVLKRQILNDSVENSLNHVIEIYNTQLQYSVYESIIFNKVIDFFSSHKQYWRTGKEDKLFKLSIILGEDNIQKAFSRSIGLDTKQAYVQIPEVLIELLEVINKYLKDDWYTNCEEAPKEREYFIGNILSYQETEIGKYI